MYIKKFLSALGIVFLSAFSCITNTAFPDENGTQELLTPENMARWKAGIASSSRSAITFDENAREIRINGYGVFYDDNDRYEDIRLDCVVNFRKFEGKYAGFSIYVRDGDGKRYWVYLRPAQRSLSAVKIHSNSKTINEYYEQGSKLALRPDTVNLNQDYTFSVEVVGRKLSAFLDGKKIIEFVDPLPEAYMRGRIGFHGSDNCDVTIKSIKVTDLTVSELLPVQSYEYINPPEKGDTSGKILTDGKINGKEEQALWWLATKGDPVIVFDLGKEYFINGVNLKALAPPNANISAYRVLASTDNDKWKTLAGEVNNSSDSREQEQVLQASFSGIARYVKAMLFRSAGDDTIKLDEVEILGREVRPEDEAAASAPEAYYTGPEIPETAMSGDSDANWFYLEGGGLRFSVSRTTGSMGPVYNLSKQERCTMVSYDAYNVETKNRDGQEFSEKDNTVIETKTEKVILTLTCRNKNIPDVDIVQTYKTTPYGISKKTEFVNRGQAKNLFLTIRTGVVLDQKFREEGWYMGADRGLGARLKASQVTLPMTTTAHSPKNTKVVLFMNYGENFGIGQYRYAINGKHCEPVAYYTEKSNHSPLYTANGWEMGLVTLHLEPGKPRSAEVHWDLFPEDEFYFFKQYTSIPEVNKKFNIDRPDWLLRLKTCPSDLGYDFGGRANGDVVTRRIKRSIDLYDDGYIYFLVTAEDVWGDWYQGERCGLGWSGQKIDNEYFREKFDELRKEFPNLKTGVYTWAWSGWQYSDSYTNHPEWYITNNKQGFPRKAYQNGPMNYMRLISAPGSMEYFLAAADKIIKQFDSDFFYIDGGGGGVNLIDWDKLTLDYDTDWEEFHWGLNKATRKAGGKERVFFTNSRSEPYVDMGFYEGVNNKLSSSSWRDSGDGMLSIKMRSSLFPKMTLIPIYWRTNTIQFYSNYCTGLGLVPENIYLSREVINVADVTAAYETRMFSFTPAELTPDWRRDIDTELEVYTLTHKPAAIFSIINHSKLPISQTVSADAAKLGIDTEKPMFLWLLRTHDARKKTTGVSERTAKEVYQRTGWGIDLLAAPEFKGIVKADDGHISITDTFDLDILNMAIFGNCPAVVFSVNGRRQQIWQPNARGITVNGSIDLGRRSMSLTTEKNITADAESAELLVYVPNDWKDISVSGAVLKQPVFIDRQKFLLLGIKGFGKISVKAKIAGPFSIEKTEQLSINDIVAPGTLSLNLPAGEKFITVYHNGAPAFFGSSEQIVLPQEIASGQYTVNAVAGSTLYTGNFDVTSSWTYPFPEINLPKTSPELKETEVNKTVKGIKILKSAVHSYNGYNLPQFTEINPDELTFAAGSVDDASYENGYSMAGLEIEGLKVVQLQVRNTFFRRWNNYERYTRRAGSANAFAGLIVDYHTPQGYTKRAAFSMGLVNPRSDSPLPGYGRKAKPDIFVRLKDYIELSAEEKFALDLGKWAPADWDGRVWISAATNGGVVGGRRLFITILGSSDAPGGMPLDEGELLTMELEQPKISVAKTSGIITIDGKIDEPAWSKAAKNDAFTLTTSLRSPEQKTEMYLCRDDANLYIAVRCGETERDKLIGDSGRLWGHDALDISFAPLPRSGRLHKFVINHVNEIYQETRPPQEKQQKWEITTATSKSEKEWCLEAAIPLKNLQLEKGEIAFNMLRYRPEASGTKAFSWGLIPEENYLEPKYFGTLIVL